MQDITPFLWFDSQAEEAVEFYMSLFAESKIETVLRYDEQAAKAARRPPGSVLTISFTLGGQRFTALNGGPVFQFTPATSLFVRCESVEEIDRLWRAFSKGGATLMPLSAYPFAERYGWLNDRFGVSWQFMVGERAQRITPALMFFGPVRDRAAEAMQFYTSHFTDAGIVADERWGAGEPGREGTVKHATFKLLGYEFIAMDSPIEHEFGFTSAISFVVGCDTQSEIDATWDRLAAGGQARPCGWLQDRYGVSWQIVPRMLPKLLTDPDAARAGRAMQAMLKMVKLDIAALEAAHAG